MIKIRQETTRDVEARETLLDACFGADRFQKTCERLREGRVPADGLSLVHRARWRDHRHRAPVACLARREPAGR